MRRDHAARSIVSKFGTVVAFLCALTLCKTADALAVAGTSYYTTTNLTAAPCAGNATAVSADGLVYVALCDGSGRVGVAGVAPANGTTVWTTSDVFNSSVVGFTTLVPLAIDSTPPRLLVVGSSAVAALDPWSGAVVQVYSAPADVGGPLSVVPLAEHYNLLPVYSATRVFLLNTSEWGGTTSADGSTSFKPFFVISSASDRISYAPLVGSMPDSLVIVTTARRAFVLPYPNGTTAPLYSHNETTANYFDFSANTSALALPPVLFRDSILLGGADGYLGWFTYGDVLASAAHSATNVTQVSFPNAAGRSSIQSVSVAASLLTPSTYSFTAVWGSTVSIFDVSGGAAVAATTLFDSSHTVVSVTRTVGGLASALVVVTASAAQLVDAGSGQLVANISLDASNQALPVGYAVSSSTAAVFVLFQSELFVVNASLSSAAQSSPRVPISANGFTNGASIAPFPATQDTVGVVFISNSTVLDALSATPFPSVVPPPVTSSPATNAPTTQSPTTQSPPSATTAAPPNATTAAPPNATTGAPPNATTAAPPNATTAAPPNATTGAPPNATTAAPPNATTAIPVTAAPANTTASPMNTSAPPAPPQNSSSAAPSTATPTTAPPTGILFTVITTTQLNVSQQLAFASKLIQFLNGTGSDISLSLALGNEIEFELIGSNAQILAARLLSLSSDQLLSLGISSLTQGTFPPSTNATTGVPATTTASPPASTGAPPTVTYTATFNHSLTTADKNNIIAEIALLLNLSSTNDIQLLQSDSFTVVFRFTGANAALLTAQFDAIPPAQKQQALGYTSLSAATDAPAAPPGGLDDQTKTIIIVCATVGGVLVIGVVGYCVVSSKKKTHVPFDEYVQMNEHSRLDVPVNYRPETGTGFGSYRAAGV